MTSTQDTAIFEGQLPNEIKDCTVQAVCPSNIALIKYWGKYEPQLPANPSISYTLNHCRTETKMEFQAGKPFSVTTYLSGEAQPAFAEKIEKYFRSIEIYLPWILQGAYTIHTENTFPHSSGIASSASGFGALALALMEIETELSGCTCKDSLMQKASFLARLGSGSACRSLYNGLIVWGETETVAASSDLFAVPYPASEVHPVFRRFNDWVLLIHEGTKEVSSTVGHKLMEGHPYAERRFREAHENMAKMQDILRSGDMAAFIRLVEHEALTLHAMMMMSEPAFILMKNGTLSVINKIWQFRKETQLPLFFTLDAGANVHLLFPDNNESVKIQEFILKELVPFAENRGLVKDSIHF